MTFPLPLAARLSGATISQLRYWRQQGILVPETPGDGRSRLYSFRDVLALRTYAWLRSDHSLQQIRRSLENARVAEAVRHPHEWVFVKLGSSIGLETTRGTVDVADHAGAEIIATMQDVLAPFTTRQGNSMRAFASPHENIAVDVGRLGGWPTIEGTRVPYDTVVQLLADGSLQPEDVPAIYPTVSIAAARDAIDFDREITSAQVAAAY